MTEALSGFEAALQGRYALKRELGRGGMATVYLAEDRTLHRRVALKLLHAELVATLGPERFQGEVAIAARLSHPHILPLYDSGQADGRLFYAMPYIEGESLRQRLGREPQLPVAETVRIVSAVAGALDYAHQAGVVHRDIKPENILLATDPSGGPAHVWVADFGLARALEAADGERLTATGLVLGTPAYMSPEQGSVGGRVDGRTDQYALGCVAYEMLAGTPPFSGPTAQAILARHAVDPVPVLRTVRPGVPEAVERAIERALAKVPADRFATATEFAQALTAEGALPLASHRSVWRGRAAGLVAGLLLVAVLAAALAPVLPWRGVAFVTGAPRQATSERRLSGGRAAKPTVAILPFTSLRSSAADDYLADGMHQELISHLGMLGDLTVIDRASVIRYRTTLPSAGTIAKQLGADLLLRGQVSHDSAGIGLTVELADARTGRVLWNASYQRRMSEAGIGVIRTEVVRGIAGALHVKVNSVERSRIDGRSTENAAAYNLYLRASQLRYGTDPSASVAAAELLGQAIALDSSFAQAMAMLGEVYWARSYRLGESRTWTDSALALARRAIQLQPALPDGYHVLALSYLDRGRLAAAETTYSDILTLNPNDGQALKVLGWIQLLRGKLPESMALLLDAHAVAPLDGVILLDLGVIERLCGYSERSRALSHAARSLDPGLEPILDPLFDDGRAGEAVSEAEQFLASHPGSPEALAAAAKAAVAAGNYPRARVHLEALSRTGPDDWDGWGLTYRTTYADVLLRVGERRRAMQLLDQTLVDARRLVESGDERPGVMRELAGIYAVKGDRQQAFAWFERAIEAGWRLEMIHPTPLLGRLASQQFSTLMVRMESGIRAAKEQIEREHLNERLEL